MNGKITRIVEKGNQQVATIYRFYLVLYPLHHSIIIFSLGVKFMYLYLYDLVVVFLEDFLLK